ncbi:SMI1/KNR4 family protein [Rhodococcus triatomae]|uniref:SMI1 / KNR4 family (SUKH-1) n=1 Tax=Rhodococcus triatomae TaxID=300028 RepID=A0A1G8Q1F1_9NOCA|nr:SMI1/KNR4 family protein [Rhodococcus triatomae]QNG19205.1 SMI1/KNR4 family protein [Rhodococcus triatomae]QNG24882.1 SMI1/KNR4 family protein [Rhodococcus triatomae]SDI98579.1 SMI1 / KNR4 family (SUKH-1) [Rhodococcus triatomae]
MKYTPGKPATEPDIAAVENKIGHRLPEPYRTWLLQHGGAQVDDMAMPTPDGHGALLEFDRPYDLAYFYRHGANAWIPPEYLAVGGGAGGAVCIRLVGPDTGAIYWADYDITLELGLDEDEYSEDIMTRLTDNWNTFLDTY